MKITMFARAMQVGSIGAIFVANALGADPAAAYSENFEGHDVDANIVRFFAGDRAHYRTNKSSVVLGNAHSGEKSFVLDVETDADYPLSYLYFENSENKLSIVPEPGQKLEGWIKVDAGTSSDLKVSLGINLIYPQGLDGTRLTGQMALKVVETGENGWQKVQSPDIADYAYKLARRNNWNPDGATLGGWLVHISGADLNGKRIVVCIDDIVVN
jgi:hypothetical protein